ncbi:predicted protein [Nematostella vectensis]|uniref:Dual adapter for phosphotyrosine and 3-phosphotyrosine and 3-phosphoinositide n=1 Tax=Nematostella vectensis TaxID=45351 RepID=A7RXJ8_NEMVE|nr:predicted protein [Nematostella vectensis]|eukprot:XP_001635921.1 predicted protein [Nematostella vectensis]
MTNLIEKLRKNIEITKVEDIPWYHPSLTRNASEVLLMTNGVEGNYLLRSSQTHDMYTVSARSMDSVKHFPLIPDGKGGYKFGIGDFANIAELMEHFRNIPVLGGECGPPVTLRFPYFNKIAEPSFYTDVTLHAVHGTSFGGAQNCNNDWENTLSNWKRRWFVTKKHMMFYFNQRGDTKPLKELDLRLAFEVEADNNCEKPNAFRVCFPERTYYIYADSKKDMEDWVSLLKWKLVNI